MPRATASPDIIALRRAVLRWYLRHRRDLPWRRTTDPYAIWVSEVMLQQTTVATVTPRWHRFLQLFPTLEALALADEADVLAEWSGLGYYARARNLHAAAREVVQQHRGALPASFEQLLTLPGMGRYTAAAVASIAFGEPVALLDANVERVLARLHAIDADVRSTAGKRTLLQEAEALLDARHPADWNQAMMELGAMICLPRAPLCDECPARELCRARAMGSQERFPVKAPKAPLESVREAAAILRRGNRVLLIQRAERGSFAGMWELPRVVVADGEHDQDAAIRAMAERAGISVQATAHLLDIKHTVMRRRISLAVWSVQAARGARIGKVDGQRAEWLTPAQWLERPASTTQRRIARLLSEGDVGMVD